MKKQIKKTQLRHPVSFEPSTPSPCKKVYFSINTLVFSPFILLVSEPGCGGEDLGRLYTIGGIGNYICHNSPWWAVNSAVHGRGAEFC